MKKGKIITLILSLSMIVAVSMSTIAFAEGSGETSQNLFYKTHYISTDTLILDDSENAPDRFFIQPNMPIELTFSTSKANEIKMVQSISIKGYYSSARNTVINNNTVVEKFGDYYVDTIDTSSIKKYATNSSGLSTILNNHLTISVSDSIYKNIYGNYLDDFFYDHSVFTTGYGMIRTTIPLFDNQGNLTEHTTLGFTNYYSQYTYFSESPFMPISMFTVGTVPLDIESDIYYKECYFYGYNNTYNNYYLCNGKQISAFKVFCWSNSAFELSDDTLYEGVYLILPSSIPPVCVEIADNVVGIGKSIHLSYVSALGSQLDNVSATKYNQGYTDGSIIGYNNGKEDGYQLGLEKANTYSFNNLITSVLDAPVKVLLGIFSQKEVATDVNGVPLLDGDGNVIYVDKDLELLGLNLSTFVRSILLIVLFIFVIKVVLSLFNINTSNATISASSTTPSAKNISKNMKGKSESYSRANFNRIKKM